MIPSQLLDKLSSLSTTRGMALAESHWEALRTELDLDADDQKSLEVFVYGLSLGYATSLRDTIQTAKDMMPQ